MKTLLLTAFLPLVVAGASTAATTVYTDQTLFLAAISDPYVETFDGINQPGTYFGPINFNSPPYSYVATESVSGFFNAGSPPPGDVWLSTNDALSTITFTFTSGNIFGVGGFFFTTDINGNAVTGNINVSLNGGPAEQIFGSTSDSFLGFVSDMPISSLDVTAVQPNQGFHWPSVNDLIVGGAGANVSVIPEPSSAMATMALLVGGLALRRREKPGSRKSC